MRISDWSSDVCSSDLCGAGDRHRLCGTGGRGGPGGAGGRSAGRRGDRTRLSRLYGVGALRLLFLGDVVGRAGRAVVTERLPGLIRDLATDFVVCNGEKAAGGFGIPAQNLAELSGAAVGRASCREKAWQ